MRTEVEVRAAKAPWVARPLNSGHPAIFDAANDVVAVVHRADLAPLATRAPNLVILLQHVRDELKHDDDGTRFADLIQMIDDELARCSRHPDSP